MCGIFGMVKNANVVDDVIFGLKKLEYRGYDSSGIAILNQGKIETVKQVGEIVCLERELSLHPKQSNIAIAHTRWATHGCPSVENAHPHVSNNGQFALVHNGIIENYQDLKQTKLSKINFVSQTDTEVAVQLLEQNFQGDVLQTLKTTCEQLQGSYAFAIITTHDPNTIYAAKKDSPLLVGVGNGVGVISSDSAPILDKTNLQYILNNFEYVKLNDKNVEFFDKNLTLIHKQPLMITNTENEISLQNFPHYMLKEIHEIPRVIPQLLSFYPTVADLYHTLPKEILKRTKHLLIVACGTAYHAGLLGARVIESLTGCEVKVKIASEFRYSNPVFHANTLAIFVSQSGETADTIAALKLCKEHKVKTVSLVNVANSTITFESDFILYTHAGKEVGVASTKAYNAQCTLFYLLASAIAVAKEKQMDCDYFAQVLSLRRIFSLHSFLDQIEPLCQSWASRFAGIDSIYLIGRQQDYATAQEAALKLKEITYIHSEAYPAGELKHGTISLIVPNTLVVAFITDSAIAEKTLNAVHEVLSRGAEVLLVTNLPFLICKGAEILQLPPVENFYAPLVAIIPIQLLAYHMSVVLGNNPDKPRNLAKSVTVE